MTDQQPPLSATRQALEEALSLSDDILRNIELSEIPLPNIALKAVRLARLLNDFESQSIFQYEVSGYPTGPNGMDRKVFGLAQKANRGYQIKDPKTSELKSLVYTEAIEQLQHETEISEVALQSARDRDVSVTSANPHQYVMAPSGNSLERSQIRATAQRAAKNLSARRTFIYEYALSKHYELKFSGIADDVFSRVRERVDSAIGSVVPNAINKLSAVYENLKSDNHEDWSNAVHSCRRILQDLADAVYAPRDDKTIEVNGKQKIIKLGKENYINRIIAFIEDKSTSDRFIHIVGSHLKFIGDRLDSVFQAAQKGSHDIIVSCEEADRFVIYTYMTVGDVLSLQ